MSWVHTCEVTEINNYEKLLGFTYKRHLTIYNIEEISQFVMVAICLQQMRLEKTTCVTFFSSIYIIHHSFNAYNFVEVYNIKYATHGWNTANL